MFFFFTIPWIFVIALVVIALGIGVSALQFILDHIIIISIILGLPVAWLVWGTWKNENSSDEEKVGWTLYPLFLVPAYAELIRLIVTVLNALDNDLWAFFLYLPTAPVVFLIILAVCMGVNCTPFVRQYGILFRTWGVFVCQRDNESTTERRR